MFQWDDYRIVKFFGVYRVRPKRRRLQVKISFQENLLLGPYFATAYNVRMLVIGFHSVPKLSKTKSDECWKRIEEALAKGGE